MLTPLSARSVVLSICLICLGLLCYGAVPPVWAQGEDEEPESSPGQVLTLGPLPAPRIAGVPGDLAPELEFLPELDPLRTRPRSGDAVLLKPGRPTPWRVVAAPPELSAGSGVTWLAAYPRFARYGEYEIEVDAPGKIALYLDGVLLAESTGADDAPSDSEDDEAADQDLEHTLSLRRGRSCLLVRIETRDDSPAAGVEIEISGAHAAAIEWSTDPSFAPARFEQTRGVAWYSGVAVAPAGKSIARRLERREAEGDGVEGGTQILTRPGTVQAAWMEGDKGTPLFFTPRGRQLVLRRDDDLVLWPMPQGEPRLLVREEAGLSVVEGSPDASYFLLVSRRGAKTTPEDPDALFYQNQLRRSVSDYLPGDGVHLVETLTGARRQLTLPGDHVIDDAIFLPQHASVLYARTLPQAERPWLKSEIRRIALESGEQTLVAEFVAGWEVRPDDLCVSPDGLRVAFTGPPDQIGSGQKEHNVYNRSLWVLDLISGEYERVVTEEGWSYNAAHDMGLLSWMDDQTLIAVVDAGSQHKIVRVLEGADGWSFRELEFEGETLSAASLSPEQSVLAYVAQSRDRASNLRLMDLNQAREFQVEDPNAMLPWKLSSPQDASFTGPGGESIEAWWYAPSAGLPPMVDTDGGRTDAGEVEAANRIPLIVYYYGGASPTGSYFNTTFQWLCANGYAVLVLQPRGAYGWGDAFADHHAGDWGPKAGADVLAGVKHFLSEHPEIDAQRVGIFGGSYGGFLTNWLLTQTQDFAAAVSYYGISDVASYWGNGEWGLTYGDMSVGGRNPYTDPEYFLKHSPFRNADAISTPLLLMHGLDDKNVRPEESMQLFTALKSQDKAVEMVLFPGETHGISGTFTMRAMQRDMMMDWFDRYLRDQGEAWISRWEKN